jgi:transposase
VLGQDPFSGAVFVFRNRRATSLKLLVYDGQGFWLCQKRLSSGRFCWWPEGPGAVAKDFEAHQLQVLVSGGDPAAARGAPTWRRVRPAM